MILEKGNIQRTIFASVTLGLEAWMYLEDESRMSQATISDLQSAIENYKRLR